MFIATLIAADRLSRGDISAAANRLGGLRRTSWIEEERAADLFFDGDPLAARAALEGAFDRVDVVVQPEGQRRKRLLVADMDSTMITVECIDELADYAGLKAQVAEITERAMQGELDFEAALDARVALLAGLQAEVIDRCREERVRITPGARELVRTMKASGATCVLVSGGFTRFAEPVAAEIGFDRVVANELDIRNGRLTGGVKRPVVGAQTKRQVLFDTLKELGLTREETLAVGDGANDIPMLREAGLGVAYHAKPATAAAAAARIEHNDLSALLYAQGYPRSRWQIG
jgi:phosphoserine phosphatase